MNTNDFRDEIRQRLREAEGDTRLQSDARAFTLSSIRARYSYNFHWLGRPIIQYPQDVMAMQELVWATRPDLIVETGIAHGGSLVLSASLLAMLDLADAAREGGVVDPSRPRRRVLGIDIDIRPHNREAILAHPLAPAIEMIEGSSVDPAVVARVHEAAGRHARVMVCLDSNHTHEHVLAELEAYAPLVTPGNYCVVFDSVVEDLPAGLYPDRGWGPGDNPKTALREYLRRLSAEGRTDPAGRPVAYSVDRELEQRLLVTVAPEGYLKRE
jgi:cephalosporin hydroxylase